MNSMLLYLFTLLDLVPTKPITYNPGKADPTVQVIVIIILILFLAFVGYLIWKSIRDKRKDD